MLHGAFDSTHTALPFRIFLKRIHREEAFFEIRDVGENKVGHQLEIRAHLSDGAQQHHPLDASERMVADHHEATFLRDVFQLFRTDFDADVHVFQQMVGELTSLIISGCIKEAVDFAQTQVAIRHPRHTGAEEAFQTQGFF